jgi:hypothetical protein
MPQTKRISRRPKPAVYPEFCSQNQHAPKDAQGASALSQGVHSLALDMLSINVYADMGGLLRAFAGPLQEPQKRFKINIQSSQTLRSSHLSVQVQGCYTEERKRKIHSGQTGRLR